MFVVWVICVCLFLFYMSWFLLVFMCFCDRTSVLDIKHETCVLAFNPNSAENPFTTVLIANFEFSINPSPTATIFPMVIANLMKLQNHFAPFVRIAHMLNQKRMPSGNRIAKRKRHISHEGHMDSPIVHNNRLGSIAHRLS